MIYTFTANPSLDRTFLVDQVQLGAYNRGEVTTLDPGGKGINVSRNLRVMGEESTLIGFFGGGTGKHILSLLEEEGYEVLNLEIEGETRSNITLIEKNQQRYTKFNEHGPEVGTGEFQQVLHFCEERIQPEDVLVLSGSLPPGLPPDAYAQIIQIVKKSGGRAFLDSSGEPLLNGCQAKPFLVHMNTKEAETYAGEDLAEKGKVIQTIQDLLGLAIPYVIISRGAQGAVLGSPEGIVEAVPSPVEVENPVGAGDAMMAGLVQGMIKDWDLERIAAWSVAAGTSSALGEGTAVADLGKMRDILQTMACHKITPGSD